MKQCFQNSSFTIPLRPDSKLEELIKPYCVINTYKERTKILEFGDAIDGTYYVKSGRVKLYILSDDGSEKILYTLSAGWFFGETPMLLDNHTELTTETMERSEIWKLPRPFYTKIFNQHESFRNAIMLNLCRKTLILRHEVENLVFSSVKERILHLFCSTVNSHKLIDDVWHPLYTSYTQYEVSTIVGSARVTTSKLINELCKEGKIRIVNRKIQVRSDIYLETIEE
ncbi:MAG: Crp/Fnr family transcriptional regulator [Spirochaetales bacterium]|nr:Crp/Fnr family transcriptional regulator [Spirochaetales bacterium]